MQSHVRHSYTEKKKKTFAAFQRPEQKWSTAQLRVTQTLAELETRPRLLSALLRAAGWAVLGHRVRSTVMTAKSKPLPFSFSSPGASYVKTSSFTSSSTPSWKWGHSPLSTPLQLLSAKDDSGHCSQPRKWQEKRQEETERWETPPCHLFMVTGIMKKIKTLTHPVIQASLSYGLANACSGPGVSCVL